MTTTTDASASLAGAATAGTTAGFVHLHVHTEFSKQDGLARVKDLAKRVAAHGMKAVAMTDHGTIGGAWKFHEACKDAKIKPIMGCEVYMALVPDGSDPDAPAMDWDDPEVRFAKTFRMEPDAESGKVKRNTNNHLTLLARNEQGWRNLCAIMNSAQQSIYYKPLIDYALLKKHSEGIIVLTGCLGGPVASRVAMARSEDAAGNVTWDEGVLNEARTNLDHLIECVGADNVYVEIMEHGLSAEGKHHIKKLTELADAANVPIVATNDSHFVDCDEHEHHDEWLVAGEWARGNKVSIDDPNRWRFNGSGFHVKTEAEMRGIYAGKRWQEACDNTVALAERIDDNVLPIKSLRLPVFPVPAEDVAAWESGTPVDFVDANGVIHDGRQHGSTIFPSPSSYLLHKQVVEGAKTKYGLPFSTEVKERLRFEEDVISTLGLPDYFLIVADVIEWARSDRGYPTAEFPNGEPGQKRPIQVGPGRGSAAGSAIAYCTDITRAEPLATGLLFERFLDIERVGMPDIDVDFERDRRDEVYIYLGHRYGQEYIARIGSFQGMKSKRAVKDAARIHGFPAKLGDKMADLIPKDGAEPMPFSRIFEEDRDKDTGEPIPCPQGREFREFVEEHDDAKKILATARAFEGVVAGESIHAAGVIISDEPLFDLLPMRYQKAKNSDDVLPIVLWDGVDCDSFGLLKLDALGLVNLDYLSACLENIRVTNGIELDPYTDIPHPDTKGDAKVTKAFQLLRAGRTQSVFQLASSGITELTTSVAPDSFEDLSAILALYRPGPMGADMHNLYAHRKNGRAEIDYGIFTDDPVEQEIIKQSLGDTFGVIVYQEQLMDLGRRVAGFDASQRSLLRKAVSKKKKEMVDKSKGDFMRQGVLEQVLPDGTISPAFRQETLETLWVAFDASAKYLFNKSHTVAYGYLSYLTAYLKANYPTEYAAAVLAVEDKDERRLAIIADTLDEGISVLPPDVNLSGFKTMPDPTDRNAVRFGLGEIRGVKNNAAGIINQRGEQPYSSLADLLARTRDADGKLTVATNVVEGLVESGALDSFGPRLGHMTVARAVGMVPDLPIPDAEWGALEKANRQRAALGFTVGENPMVTYRHVIDQYRSDVTVDLDTGEDSSTFAPKTVDQAITSQAHHANVVGLLTGWSERITRAGDRMANFTMEGERTRLAGTVFPGTYKQWSDRGRIPAPGTLVAITGALKKTQVFGRDEDEDSEDNERVELFADRAVNLTVPNLPSYAETRSLSKRQTDEGAEKLFSYLGKQEIARLAASLPSDQQARETERREKTARKDADVLPMRGSTAKRKPAVTRPAVEVEAGADAALHDIAQEREARSKERQTRRRWDDDTTTTDAVMIVNTRTGDSAVPAEGFDVWSNRLSARYFNSVAVPESVEAVTRNAMIVPYRFALHADRDTKNGRIVALRVRSKCTQDRPKSQPLNATCQHPECPPRYAYLLMMLVEERNLHQLGGTKPAAAYLVSPDTLPAEAWKEASRLHGITDKNESARFSYYVYTPQQIDEAIAQLAAEVTQVAEAQS